MTWPFLLKYNFSSIFLSGSIILLSSLSYRIILFVKGLVNTDRDNTGISILRALIYFVTTCADFSRAYMPTTTQDLITDTVQLM